MKGTVANAGIVGPMWERGLPRPVQHQQVTDHHTGRGQAQSPLGVSASLSAPITGDQQRLGGSHVGVPFEGRYKGRNEISTKSALGWGEVISISPV